MRADWNERVCSWCSLRVCFACRVFTVHNVYSSLQAATYYDVDIPSDKILEHLDDILLRPGFLEVCATGAVRFLERRERLNPYFREY